MDLTLREEYWIKLGMKLTKICVIKSNFSTAAL
jgi:hypothetical protein